MNKIPTRAANYAEWYQAIVKKAKLATHAPTRGCMIIQPYGYAIWEKIKNELDKSFKETGHQNAYFPLLIPQSHLTQEAKHVEGFAKECAVVTHYRLATDPKTGSLQADPTAKLDEPLIVRPTSETIIWNSYREWIQSYRDLPLLINQWANVIRWEMRTRPFLRTTEFLWQEGHTAHATQQEAEAEAKQMLQIYNRILTEKLSLAPIIGRKTVHERFAGAEETYTLEAMMQDGKALQAGTSHYLGQNFAKAFNVTYTDRQGDQQFVWGTSWGVTTRLIGALVMSHADDHGLILPPAIAPYKVVIIPIFKKEKKRDEIIAKCEAISNKLKANGISVLLDLDDQHKPGWKFTQYEMQGIPLRIAIGAQDLEKECVELTRRDDRSKELVADDRLLPTLQQRVVSIQENLLKRARERREKHTQKIDNFDTFRTYFKQKKGFALAHWDGTTETEKAIKKATQATIRCIPFEGVNEAGHCIYTGKKSTQRVLFAHAY